jgi:hypothetical protein
MNNKIRYLAAMIGFAGACSPSALATAPVTAPDVEMLPRAERPLLAENTAPPAAEGAPAVLDAPATVAVAEASRPDPHLLGACDAPRSIVIYKAARTLELWCGAELAARYDTSLGFAPAGDKVREGDGKTPEGEYRVTLKYPSKFHRSLQINYPNIADAERGLRDGIISRAEHDAIVLANRQCRNPPQDTALGSYVQIHGGGGGTWAGDWTLGCVAVNNDFIEEVFAFHRAGCNADGSPRTKIVIKA